MALTHSRLHQLPNGRHSDGSFGLYLDVRGKSRAWIQRVTIDGKRTNLGLGPWPLVSLTEAREAAFENARTIRRGGDPRAERKRDASIPTFAAACDAYIELQRSTWKNGKNESNWRSSLAHAAPIADRPINAIGTDDVLAIIGGLVRAGKQPTAKALRQRIAAVMEWARAEGHRTDNPADARIDAALPRNGHKTTHRAAVPFADVPDALRRIRAIDRPTWAGMKLAAEFLILTGMRSGEVLGADWSEIDLEARCWTVPAARMKMVREHRVPLSDAAVAVLEAARARHGSAGLVFRSPTGRQIDRLIPVLRAAGIREDVHGFRSSLRDWCSDSGVDEVTAERCIAHYEADKTRKAYHRTDRYEARVVVMQQWGRFVTGSAAPKVVSIAG